MSDIISIFIVPILITLFIGFIIGYLLGYYVGGYDPKKAEHERWKKS
jgi:ABC-type dipeptide/oligopeptide/nickel transport system permease subunit